MKPIINLDDPVVRNEGQPAPAPPSTEAAPKIEATSSQEKITLNIPRKGVYRFKTFEEADEWMEKRIVRNPKK